MKQSFKSISKVGTGLKGAKVLSTGTPLFRKAGSEKGMAR